MPFYFDKYKLHNFVHNHNINNHKINNKVAVLNTNSIKHKYRQAPSSSIIILVQAYFYW